MDISPYLFNQECADPFEAQANKVRNAYFWATVFELGTGVDTHKIYLPEEGIEYLLVDTAKPGEGCMTPEDFLLLLTGHEENRRYWGYGWTIYNFNKEWMSIIKKTLPQYPPSASKYAVEVDNKHKRVNIIDKEYVWKIVSQPEF